MKIFAGKLKLFEEKMGAKSVRYINKLRKSIILSLCINLPILIIYLVLSAFFDTKLAKIEGLKRNNFEINLKIVDFKKRIEEIKKADNLMQKLGEKNQNKKNINIDDANKLISDLERRYKLPTRPSVTINTLPDTFNDSNQDIKISTLQMNIDVGGFSDEMLLGFALDLVNNLPGFAKFTNFELRKSRELDNKAFEEISNNQKPVIVTAKISILWQDVQEINNKTINKEAAELENKIK